MDWPCHPSRSLLRQHCLALNTRGKAKEGSSEDHVAMDGGESNSPDGKDVEQHFSHGEGPAEVERSRCCPTRHPAECKSMGLRTSPTTARVTVNLKAR